MLKLGIPVILDLQKCVQPIFSRSASLGAFGGFGFRKENVKCKKWLSYNDKIYPPQTPEEPRRPGYVCHVIENKKYSYQKMWYVACFIRGMSVDEALKQLQFIKSEGSQIAREAILIAQEKAVKEHNIEFKTNLWVSESFVGKAERFKGYRRCARGRMTLVRHDFIHYFITLEEGSPPEHYYYHKRPKSGEEMLQEWIQEMRNRKVIEGL